MAKFYVHRSNYAWVTEVTEVEATDRDDAYDKIMNGEGDLLGHSIGDNCNFLENESIEVLDAAPHNIPACFSVAEKPVQS